MSIPCVPPRKPSDVRTFNAAQALKGHPYGTQDGAPASIFEWEAHDRSNSAEGLVLVGEVHGKIYFWSLKGEGVCPIFMWPVAYINDTPIFANDQVLCRNVVFKVTLNNVHILHTHPDDFLPYIELLKAATEVERADLPKTSFLTYDQMQSAMANGHRVEQQTDNMTWMPLNSLPAPSARNMAGVYRLAAAAPQVKAQLDGEGYRSKMAPKTTYDPEDLTYAEVVLTFDTGFQVLINDGDGTDWRPTAFTRDTFTEAKYNISKGCGCKFKALVAPNDFTPPSPDDLTYFEACDLQTQGHSLQYIASHPKGSTSWRQVEWRLDRANPDSFSACRFRLTPGSIPDGPDPTNLTFTELQSLLNRGMPVYQICLGRRERVIEIPSYNMYVMTRQAGGTYCYTTEEK